MAFGTLPDRTLILATASNDHTARLWNPATGEHLHTLADHADLVWSVAFGAQPDGTVLLATASLDRTARLWNPATGQHLNTLIGHTDAVTATAFGTQPDGTLILATASHDGIARLWDPATGQHLNTLTGHTTAVTATTFGTQPDGTLILATASNDRTARLWDPATGQHLHTLTGHTDQVIEVAFGAQPDGTLILATASADGTAQVWNPATGQHLHTLDHPDEVNSVAFAPDHSLLAAGSDDNHAYIWDIGRTVSRTKDSGIRAIGEPSLELTGHRAFAAAFGTLPDGTQMLATACDDDTARLWDPATGEHHHTLTGHTNIVWAAAIGTLPDGTLILATAGDDTPRLWNPATGQQLLTLTGHTGHVRSIAFGALPGGTTVLATASNTDQTARLWNPADGQQLHTLTGHTGIVNSVAFGTLPDGTLILATASDDHTARLWDPVTGQQLDMIDHPQYVDCVAFSSSQAIFVTGCADRIARVWRLPSSRDFRPATDLTPSDVEVTRDPMRFTGHTGYVEWAAFGALPDGTLILATASTDHTARLWNPFTGDHLHTLTGHTDNVRSVAFATQPDGTPILATASHDGTARLWNPATGQHLHTLTGHRQTVYSVAFGTLPDGTLILATASHDTTAQLWNPATGQHLHTLSHSDAVATLAFHTLPEGVLLLATDVIQHAGDPDSPGEPALWRIVVRSRQLADEPLADGKHSTSAETLRVACSGVVRLSTVDMTPPLGLLVDLTMLTSRAQPPDTVAALAHHAGIEKLRTLSWPAAARVGLAALLLEGLSFEPVYTPPQGESRELYHALRKAMTIRSGPRVAPVVPAAAILANADRITDRTLTMLEVIGPDAVAVDPLLPLRMRDQAEAMPPIREQVHAAVAHLLRDHQSGTAHHESAHAKGTIVGINRRGTLTNLIHTQLALPQDLFTLRYASNDLLYRLHHRPSEPLLDDLTLILDTSPATFGPIETVLRLVAHCIVITVWRGNGTPRLITMSEPDRLHTMSRPADLTTIWTQRSLHPPRLAEAIDCAQHQMPGNVVLLTTDQLAHDHSLIGTPNLRVITTSMPDRPPARAVTTRYRLRLAPRPRPADIAEAVCAVLIPAGESP